jgi:DNA-binding GntR family transcriptional regulator
VSPTQRPILGSRTAELQIVDLLRERILSGELAVGARLRQMDLSEELGVSITPVREAFRSLAAEGLVQIDSHRGAVVRELTDAEKLEIFELQLLLEETNLAYAIPVMTDQALDLAEQAQVAMRETREPARWALLNRDFHLALALPADRPRVHRLLAELLNLSAVNVSGQIATWAGRREEALAEHDGMLAAARAGDIPAAQRILHQHTTTPIQNLRASMGLED